MCIFPCSTLNLKLSSHPYEFFLSSLFCSSLAPQSAYSPSPPTPHDSPPECEPEELCRYCCHRRSEVVSLSCGHLSLCLKCQNRTRTCPTCGRRMRNVVHVFRTTPWNRQVRVSFEHLKNKHVIWLDARISLCDNLAALGFNVETDSEADCRRIIRAALNTQKFVLVIDDALAAPEDSPVFKLYVRYVTKKPQFRIFLTVSNDKLYYEKLHTRLKRTAIEFSVPYSSSDVLEKLCQSYNISGLEFDDVLSRTGPSLRLVDDYLHRISLLKLKCVAAQNDLRLNFKPHIPVLLEFTQKFTNDYVSLDLSKLSMTEDQFELLLTNSILSGDYEYAFFHDPIIRRAACTLFESYNLPSCNVTLCHQI
ncbi:hypothetical protein GEMRC1_006334 [Eukaryota sp. GEM-RC1]